LVGTLTQADMSEMNGVSDKATVVGSEAHEGLGDTDDEYGGEEQNEPPEWDKIINLINETFRKAGTQ
jgi:hypothetical protein